MKLLVGILLGFSLTANAQLSDTDLNEIWTNNILSIANMETDKILEMTEFPLEGEWAIVVGIEEEPTIEHYKTHLADIFSDDMRAQMLTEDYTRLTSEEIEEGAFVVSYSYLEIFVEDDYEYESMTFLTFEKRDGIWKLVAITYAG